jgi:alkylhydroperoxidase family enzyme
VAWIRWVDEDDADGRLADLYRRYRDPQGIDHILKIHSLNPESLEGHVRYYAHLMRGPSDLTRPEREMIAVTVSHLNGCHY